jgi:hypothetical protein
MVYLFDTANHWMAYKLTQIQALFEGLSAFGRYAIGFEDVQSGLIMMRRKHPGMHGHFAWILGTQRYIGKRHGLFNVSFLGMDR